MGAVAIPQGPIITATDERVGTVAARKEGKRNERSDKIGQPAYVMLRTACCDMK